MKLLLILFLAFLTVSCTHKPLDALYNISAPDTTYSGDTTIFNSSIVAGANVHWFFGNAIQLGVYTSASYSDPQNVICASCAVLCSNCPFICDTLNGLTCKHAFITPGTYKIVMTVNGDSTRSTTKTMVVRSPGILAARMNNVRTWKRTIRDLSPSWDSTIVLPDTTFAVTANENICSTPHSSADFSTYHSSSSLLNYQRRTDFNGSWTTVTYSITGDSISIYENKSYGQASHSVYYTSGH